MTALRGWCTSPPGNGESALPESTGPTGKRSARKRACSVWSRGAAAKPYLSLHGVGGGLPQDGLGEGFGYGLQEELEYSPVELRHIQEHAREIAARLCEAGHHATRDRIGFQVKNPRWGWSASHANRPVLLSNWRRRAHRL